MHMLAAADRILLAPVCICEQAPINPSDINTVQGKYPLVPPLPGAIPGHEGVAQVVRSGSKVSNRDACIWPQRVHSLCPVPIHMHGRQHTGTSPGPECGTARCCERGVAFASAQTECLHACVSGGLLGQVQSLQPGDHVVPLAAALGTWRTGGLWSAAGWHKVPADLPLEAAATLTIK